MPPWRLVRRVRTTRYITGHAVSARFGLIRAGGGVRQPLPSSRERGKIPPTLNNQSDGHPAGHAPPPPGPSRQNSAPHHGKRGVRSIWFCSSRGGRALAASTLARDKAKKIPPTHNNQSEGRPAGHAPPPLGLSRQNHAPHHGRRGVCSIWFCSSRGGRAAAASTLSRNKAKKILPTLNKDELFWMFHHEHNKYRRRQNKPRHMVPNLALLMSHPPGTYHKLENILTNVR